MRWIFAIFVVAAIALVGGYFYLIDLPYVKYTGWVSGNVSDKYFEIPNYNKLYLSPTKLEDIPEYQEDYVQLWKDFPIRNTSIPLPVRHPFYRTIPIAQMSGKNAVPQFGIILQTPTGREISRVYTLPNRLYQDRSQGQELFKLPFIKKKILGSRPDDLWRDIFTHKIEIRKKSLDAMIHDLYILHIRSQLLPADTVKYGLIEDGKLAMIELASKDKDYRVELVLNQVNGSIFSYILKTEINKSESTKIRAKFIQGISFTPIDESLGDMLYTEFKNLNYARQIDNEGMLYLFSAWTQNPDNTGLLKEMINFLERGVGNKKQLNTLYKYSYARYGKTFTNRNIDQDMNDSELELQRKIEIEYKAKRMAAEADSNRLPQVQELTPDEKMNLYLRKAKEKKAKASPEEMTIH